MEPAIYYQSAYIKLLSKFVDARFSKVKKSCDETSIPELFTLKQNYPNPFNSSTVIANTLHQSIHLKIQIYNVLDQIVRTLVDKHQLEGEYTIFWDGFDGQGKCLSSGTYLYRMSGALQYSKECCAKVKRMLFLR